MPAILLCLASLFLGQSRPATATSQSSSPPLALEHLGTVRLDAEKREQARWLVLDFDIDERGRIGFIEAGTQNRTRFLLLNTDGSVAAELPLEIGEEFDFIFAKLRWIDADDWIILGINHRKPDNKAWAWHVDVAERKVRKLDPFDCPPTETVARDRQGGFLVYSILPTPIAGVAQSLDGAEIIAFDLNGRRKHRIEIPKRTESVLRIEHGGMPPFHAEITTTSDGRIVLLNTNNQDIHILNDKGAYRQTIFSGYMGGCTVVRSASIAIDLDGGVIVTSAFGDGFRRVDIRKAEARASSQPEGDAFGLKETVDSFKRHAEPPKATAERYPDGRSFRSRDPVRVSPDGHLWTSDSRRLLRLTNDGVVDKVLGESLNDEIVSHDISSFIDWQGRTYLMNSRTGSVHVFDANGKRLHVCRSKAEDFKGSNGFYIAVRPDGGVYVWQWQTPCLSFDSKGERLGFVELGAQCRGASKMLVQPDGMGMWILANNNCLRVDKEGKHLLTVWKRPDGKDLRNIRDAAIAPDGSLAILEQERLGTESRETFCRYSSEGKPLLAMPAVLQHWGGLSAFDGHRVVSIELKGHKLMMYDMDTGTQRELYAGLKDEGWRGVVPFFSMQGRELWLFHVRDLVIERFKIPA